MAGNREIDEWIRSGKMLNLDLRKTRQSLLRNRRLFPKNLSEYASQIAKSSKRQAFVEKTFEVTDLRYPRTMSNREVRDLGFALLEHLGLGKDDALRARIDFYLRKFDEPRSSGSKQRELEREETGGPGAERQQQPPESIEGVPLKQYSTKELMIELTARDDISDETRQRLLWDIADFDRPKWKDKEENPEKLAPELRYAPAPVFLKIAWADEFDTKGRIYTQRVRHSDRKLMTAVEHYLDNRKGKDPLHAKGITLVTGPVPTEPKGKMKVPRDRISAMHLRND